MKDKNLEEILQAELSLGNSISSTEEGGWEKCNLIVSLEKSFARKYKAKAEEEGLVYYQNEDSHYPKGITIYSSTTKEALFERR